MAHSEGQEVFDVRKTLVGDDAVGLLAKLLWEIEQLHVRSDESLLVRMFMSFNAASTAWHIHEWLWKLSDDDRKRRLLDAVDAPSRDFKGLVRGLQQKSPALAICRQLATAGKHMTVHHDRDDIFAEILEEADESHPAGSVLLVWNGERHRDVDVYGAALVLWLRVYVALGLKHASEVNEAADWVRDLPR